MPSKEVIYEVYNIVKPHDKHILMEEFDFETPLGDSGLALDSITRLTLLTKIEERFGCEFPDEYWGSKTFYSLGEIATYIDSLEELKD